MGKRTLEENFWVKVDRWDPDHCWEWTGAKIPGGYASLAVPGTSQVGAHRVAYELCIGPIPGGLHLDHLCRNRGCVNPKHLEPVTSRENILRGQSPGALNARKTHCKQGHEFTAENTYVIQGGRRCRACNRAQAKADYYAHLAIRRERARDRQRVRRKGQAS